MDLNKIKEILEANTKDGTLKLPPGALESLPITEAFELYGRVENVTNERYATAGGYGTLGRTAYAGVRARF